MKHVFIVNPTSGKGKSVKMLPVINDYFLSNPGDYEIIITDGPKDATKIASRFHKEDDIVLYSVGGDGTAKEILDGINPGVPLCVIPAGTGNDFFKSIDRRKLTDKELIAALIEGENIDIDYGVLNGNSRFMNLSSFGIDADINVYACDVLKVKYNIPGKFVYAVAALKVGTHPQNIEMDLVIDGKEYHRSAVMCAIANGRYYGGTFKPTPDALLDDGYFDVCIVKGPIKLKRFAELIIKYTKGTHITEPEIEILHGRNIELKFEQDVYLQVDGENRKIREANIELIPHGLCLRVPRKRQVD